MNETRILERTSRSFYLTLRMLPRTVRGDASLGYLLARATDTIADTPAHPAPRRAAMLRAAAASLGRKTIEGYAASDWAAAQRDPSEHQLLEALPGLWQRAFERPIAARERLMRVMAHILEGQIFDLERFTPGAEPLSDAELDHYTFLVAGSVGEFWTDLCAGGLRDFSRDPTEDMRARGRRYGQALQLVNILRDRRMDDALGRIYVREEDMSRHATRAREWLGDAVSYCESLRSGRLRYATLLPALLGWRTLALLDASHAVTPVKVSRPEVRRWLRRAMPVWWSPAAVPRLAREAAGQNYKANTTAS